MLFLFNLIKYGKDASITIAWKVVYNSGIGLINNTLDMYFSLAFIERQTIHFGTIQNKTIQQ